MTVNFRHHLRVSTASDHQAVDDIMSNMDVMTHAGFVSFLTVHRMCFDAMSKASPAGHTAKSVLDDLISRIDADLKVLGAPIPSQDPQPLGTLDPLAIDYVVEGSRLGSKVLRRRWEGTSDPVVKSANAYFSHIPPTSRWQQVCSALAEIETAGPRADRIGADTRKLFGIFRHAADQATRQLKVAQ
ncbi:biliverdin-producing heme oxygenase [Pseudooctadecabacter jejudonensis]|uniref:Heme oxygenase n=1 Tax=Pseudooctadecabacter jejudonensis TaxID=1391910 RepID=A0A1Y5SSD0_9RHOB|nr:biliverdin-producing heme oxygenase [Pseudooctadecabacter jejudonensis]SLN44160.1 hypothetical protein PSJ8397_02282 [Pseudooctadecabacter jejudonensis]